MQLRSQLTPDDKLFLQTICHYFHEQAAWPALGWLEKELVKYEDIDIWQLETRLLRLMYNPDYPHQALVPGRQIKLTPSIMGLCLAPTLYPEIREDLNAFISVLRMCLDKYSEQFTRSSIMSSPRIISNHWIIGDPLTVTEYETRTTLSISPSMARKAYLLIEQDFNIHGNYGHKLNGSNEIVDWYFQISRDIVAYRKVQTIEDYLAVNAKRRAGSTGSMNNTGHNPIISANNDSRYEYDVAISFAGTERDIAEQLAIIVQNAGYRVFYDKFYTPELWGTDLVVTLDEIYRKKARYCVMFFSSEYVARMWTNHERRSATARMVAERGNEYLLPIMVEHVEVPGIAPTISYLSLSEHSIPEIANILIAKLQKS